MNESLVYRISFYERIIVGLACLLLPVIELYFYDSALENIFWSLALISFFGALGFVFKPIKLAIEYKSIFKAGKILWTCENEARFRRGVEKVAPSNFKKASAHRWNLALSIFFFGIGSTAYFAQRKSGLIVFGVSAFSTGIIAILANLKFGQPETRVESLEK